MPRPEDPPGRRRPESLGPRRPSARGPLAAAVACLLLVATVVVAAFTAEHDRADTSRITDRRADQAVAALRATLSSATERLEDAAALLSAEGMPDERLARDRRWEALRPRLFSEPTLVGTGVAPVVPHEDRDELERGLGRTLQEPGPGGVLHPAPVRERYVVPVAVGYRDGTKGGLGVDISAEPRRRAALLRAEATGTAQITAPLRLVDSGVQAIVVYAPIYRTAAPPPTRAEREDSLVGYVVGSYGTAAILREIQGIVGTDSALTVTDGATLFSGSVPPDDPTRRAVSIGGHRLVVAVETTSAPTSTIIAILTLGATIALLVGLLLRRSGRRERDAVATREREARRREAAETQFVAAFEQAPIGMAIIDLDGTITRVNDALGTLTGYPREVMTGRPLADILHPDGAPDVRQLARGDDERLEAEQRLLTSDGTARWAATTATTMRDDGGAVSALLVQVQDVTERRAYEQRLQHLANHDPLTGLLNRRAFGDELDRQASRVQRYGDRGAVLMLDLDHFKAVNDTLGHSAGDRLIIEVAHRLRARLRESDVLARLGGDEFAVLLPEVDAQEAEHVAGELLSIIRATTVPHRPHARPITASIGIALITGGDEANIGEDLLVRADLALYDAKDAGRDRMVVYAVGPHESARTEARLSWIQRLHEALDTGALTLHYQPIVDLRTGRTTAAEALVRLRQPDGDLVAPAAFLSIAERYGLAPRLDRWVFERAVLDLATLRGDDGDVTVSVNVSAHSIADPAFLSDMERIITADGGTAGHLLVELTETAAVKDIPQAQAFARRLHELGGRLALDDFGAGFGSFYYLKHLPFDVLKIDGEFVRSATTTPLDRDIVRAIVEIARGAGSLTVAEHVGSDSTADEVRRLGVDLGQGFHLGRPMPLAELRERLDAERAEAAAGARPQVRRSGAA